MLASRIAKATRVVGRQQGYQGLAVRDIKINCKVNGPDTPAMVTAWEPNPAELALLNAGATIHVTILGVVPPPMMVTVGPVPEESE